MSILKEGCRNQNNTFVCSSGLESEESFQSFLGVERMAAFVQGRVEVNVRFGKYERTDNEGSVTALERQMVFCIISQIGTASEKERETEQFDSQAMKYLSYLLYPLVLAGAVYSLVYNPHKRSDQRH